MNQATIKALLMSVAGVVVGTYVVKQLSARGIM